ncbi:RidA family protein [Spirosoma validum]|uniref:RidA family protein n=1 Tax=Spirosoma validum TaxID=2771355 RepID=A0A927B294_9BACT|nr:RidA family protein [Spirosoma validum]MBD2754249.1 RidA family protein [Spirosoma validum]
MKNLIIFLGWVLLTSCSQAQSIDVPTPDMPTGYLYKIEPGIPGKEIYICGEHPFNKKGEVVASGDLNGQTRQVFENIKTSLATVNMTFKDVTQITYSIKGTSTKVREDTAALLSNVGALYFTQPPKLVELKSVPKIVRDEVLIEVEVIAMK